MWWGALLKGVGLGFALSMLIGPVFFALIDTGIRKGLREGAKMALGINISDWLYASVMALGIGGLVTQIGSSHYFTMAGGVVLVLFGAYNFLPKKPMEQPKAQEALEQTDLRRRLSGVGKGFVLNSLNPGTPAIWLAASSAGANYLAMGGIWLQAFFIICILVTVLGTDLMKVYLGRRFLKELNPKRIVLINRGVGIIMIAAGLRFLWLGLEGKPIQTPKNLDQKIQEAAIRP